MKMKKLNVLFLSILTSGFLIGCGGGGGASSSATTSSDTILSGSFIDAPVEGLKYSTPTQSGFTDENGTFKYKQGEKVQFSIGNFILGETIGQNIVTPLTISGDVLLSEISTKSMNIARLVQSLDENGLDEKIKIPKSLHNLSLASITINDELELQALLNEIVLLSKQTFTLKSQTEALNHMNTYIKRYYPECINAEYKYNFNATRVTGICGGSPTGTNIESFSIKLTQDDNCNLYENNIKIGAIKGNKVSLSVDDISIGFSIIDKNIQNSSIRVNAGFMCNLNGTMSGTIE